MVKELAATPEDTSLIPKTHLVEENFSPKLSSDLYIQDRAWVVSHSYTYTHMGLHTCACARAHTHTDTE